MKKTYQIIFEDKQLLLLNKAANVLTIPDRFAPEKYNLLQHLSLRNGSVFVVHRLDKETSGLLVFAKTPEAHKALSEQFQQRTVEKHYLALLDGVLPGEQGSIDEPLAPHPGHLDRMVVSKKGKPSLTTWQVLERFRNFTYVQAAILTGRTHQIRVHFEHIGHPLAVDSLYGKRQVLFLSEFKDRNFRLGKDQDERPLISRLTLHAASLSFEHPHTGERLAFQAPAPKDFGAVLNQLRKWGK